MYSLFSALTRSIARARVPTLRQDRVEGRGRIRVSPRAIDRLWNVRPVRSPRSAASGHATRPAGGRGTAPPKCRETPYPALHLSNRAFLRAVSHVRLQLNRVDMQNNIPSELEEAYYAFPYFVHKRGISTYILPYDVQQAYQKSETADPRCS
jgi:hypothetical protein